MRSRRGLALILVVGVLGILSVLAMAFAVLGRLERHAAVTRVHATRALLLARSGLEDGLARVTNGQDPSLHGNRYGGENWNLNFDLDGIEEMGPYRPSEFNVACPVRYALRPSFFVRGALGPQTLLVDGRPRGYSGSLTGAPTRSHYAMKVDDESAKINVNGGVLGAAANDPTPGWNGAMARLIDTLCDGQFSPLGWWGVTPPAINDGNDPITGACAGSDLLLNRPSGGYRSIEEVNAVLRATRRIDVDLSPWLTVTGRSDERVIRPNGFLPSGTLPGPTAEVVKARGPLRLEEGGRPPVNINGCQPAVLYAMVKCLSAVSQANYMWVDRRKTDNLKAGAVQQQRILLPAKLAMDRDASPIRSWGEFYRLLQSYASWSGSIQLRGFNDTAGQSMAGGGQRDIADLLMAGFDPNSGLNKFLPDQLRFRWVDKSDLITWGTEGCLFPQGTFRLSAVGRVLREDGGLLAERTLETAVDAYALVHHTTQKDFVAGRGDYKSYLSLADPPYRTTGASNPSWKTWSEPEGLGVMTYPHAPPAVTAGNAAEEDGWIGLAPMEIAPEIPSGGTMRFLHHFDDSWDADLSAGGDGARKPGPFSCDSRLQTDLGASCWPDAGEPNTLFPEGFHSQRRRNPAFLTQTNLPPPAPGQGFAPQDYGCIGYWCKPYVVLSGSFGLDFTCTYKVPSPPAQPRLTQSFWIGHNPYQGSDIWGCMYENSSVTDNDESYEIQRRLNLGGTARPFTPNLSWQFVGAFWNAGRARGTALDADITIRSLRQELAPQASYDEPTYPRELFHFMARTLTAPGQCFALGSQEFPDTTGMWPTFNDAMRPGSIDVLDEFAIYDFGPDAAAAKGPFDLWTLNRYQEGRYYKGDDATYVSPVLTMPDGRPARGVRAYWTAYLPAESRWEMGIESHDKMDYGQERPVDLRLAGASVALRLKAPGGGVQSLGRQGEEVRLPGTGLRYEAVLKSGVADPMNTPVLETPVLDDVTVLVQAPSGPRFLSWAP